jgi:DNA-binding transcriptional MerR regulator
MNTAVLLDEGIRGPVVCDLARLTYRQLDYWVRAGLVTPSVCDAKGSGSVRRFSARDVLLLAILSHLIEIGISMQSMRRTFNAVAEQLPADLHDSRTAIVVWTPQHMRVIHDQGGLSEVLSNTDDAIALLPLRSLVERISAHLAERDEGPDAPGPSSKANGDVSIAVARAS